MSISTAFTVLQSYNTDINLSIQNQIELIGVGSVNTSLNVVSNPVLQLINSGLIGPKGNDGQPGIQGPEYQGNDLPDFTLIFDNKLI